jgi:hypothetical protein
MASEPHYPNYATYLINGNARGYIQDVELGALAGIGIDIPVYKAFNITMQYIFSISLISKDSKWGENSYRYMENKVEVGMAYQFIGKNKKDKDHK